MAFFGYLEDESGIADLIRRHARRFLPISTFTQDIMRGPSELSVAQREFIAAFVSRLNGCRYCVQSHTTQTVLAGIPEEAVQAAERDIASAPVDEAFKPMLAFVKALTFEPGNMNKELADAVYAAGWSEVALEDAIFVTCAFNFYNRWLDGHGIHGSREKVSKMAPILHEKGYLAYNQKLVDEMEISHSTNDPVDTSITTGPSVSS